MKSKIDESQEMRWYCVQTQAHREHVVAAHLHGLEEIVAFCPRIRFKRSSRGGNPTTVTEALFPGYLFVQCRLMMSHRFVRYAHGVRNIIQFGDDYVTIPDPVIDELRTYMQVDAIREIPVQFPEGSRVEVVNGSFRGLSAVVLKFMPAKDRVRVLLEFLGRQMEAELPTAALLSRDAHPLCSWS